MHPGRQEYVSGSQTGALVPQSALERHCLHVPSRARHRGELAGQSVFVWHCTHCCVAASQIFESAGQSLAVLHPTQSPVVALQSGALFGQLTPAAHGGWHWLSDAQHAGVVPLQSAFDVQVTHDPWRQCGAAAGQFASALHSTQPNTGSQNWPESQLFAPFTPQSALPPPGPVVTALVPLHATKSKRTPPDAATQCRKKVRLAM